VRKAFRVCGDRGSGGISIVRVRYTPGASPTSADTLAAVARTGAGCYEVDTLWLDASSDRVAGADAIGPAGLGRLAAILRSAARWVARERYHRQSLLLAKIYAEVPLAATAF
jgi:hypothetical protein